MMNKPTRIAKNPLRLSLRKRKLVPPGAAPGLITVAEDAKKPRLSIISYNSELLFELPVLSLSDIRQRMLEHPELQHWIEIRGFGDRQLMEDICQEFNIHRLEMEDVLSTYQRPKLEEHEKHVFIVSRVITRGVDGMLKNDQLSLFVEKGLVISMQEQYDDYFEPVRSRIRTGKGYLRQSGSDYLAYALLDSIVDMYFPMLEKMGDILDELEDELFDKPTRRSLQRIQATKRELIVFRRTVFAERDKINDLLRTHTIYISDQTKLFLKDTYDHTIQVMDLVESYKEITASLMDIYLSSVSNRMNQIMKVLAIISTIFIPLTFIVGVYGMNFADINPITGEKLLWNMPELYSPVGYLSVMIFMAVLVVIQLLFFWKKGWLDKT